MYFQAKYMLENDNINLRPLEISDVDLLYAWENDRANWKISHTISPYSKHVLADYINSVTDIYSDKQLRLIIETKPGKNPVGAVDLFDCDFSNKRVGVGILIADPKNRGKGIASQVLELVIDYCFDVLGMHQIYCNILVDNPGSIGLFEKFGFNTIGVKKDWTVYKGAFFDELIMQKINKNG